MLGIHFSHSLVHSISFASLLAVLGLFLLLAKRSYAETVEVKSDAGVRYPGFSIPDGGLMPPELAQGKRSSINVRGDANGHVVGVVVSPDKKPVVGTDIRVQLLPEELGRSTVLQTDEFGAFILDYFSLAAGTRPTHLSIKAAVGDALEKITLPVSDVSLGLTAIPAGEKNSLTLQGVWRFRMDPPDGFHNSDFDDKDWLDIQVPSHWIMKGFDSPRRVGGYRRWMDVPRSWKGQRIRLRFEGVHTEAEVWVNGVRVGGHDGGATPFEFDITEALQFGRENLFAVLVNEFSDTSDVDNMSFYLHFPLGGIYRDVSLYKTPPLHVARLQADTDLDAQYQNATLKVAVTVANESDATVSDAQLTIALRGPDGKSTPVATHDIRIEAAPWSRIDKVIDIPIELPKKWDPEHPVLYDLGACLKSPGQHESITHRKIGFRKVEIRDSSLLVNGVALKLMGAARHDAHPLLGRAITPEIARQDLELMKSANMTGFRTAHYPPIPQVIEIADELGLGVEEEAAICFVGAPWGPKPRFGVSPVHDPWYLPIFLQQVAELIERDRSHPSVLWWSLANESDWGPSMEWMKLWVKKNDPTRPVSEGGFAQLEITMAHNPTLLKQISDYKKFGTPVLGEEAMAIFLGWLGNGPELDVDPGMRDLWVKPFIPVVDEVRKSPWWVGLFTWCWVDDLFMVPGTGTHEWGRWYPPFYPSSLEMGIYAQPNAGVKGEASWGIIDGWRRPRPEYWHHKKLYSPVKLPETPVTVSKDGTIEIPIENRFDYSNLSEIQCAWRIGTHDGDIKCDLPPQSSGTLRVPAPKGIDLNGQILEISFSDQKGRLIDMYSLPLGTAPAQEVSETDLPAPFIMREPTTLVGSMVRLIGKDFDLGFDENSGRLWRGVVKGRQALIEWPTLHVLPNTDAYATYPAPRTWFPKKVDFQRDEKAVTLTLDGQYQDFDGVFTLRIDGEGRIETRYRFVYQGAGMTAREIGLRAVVPSWCDTLDWSRNGEWSWYPPDHIGRREGHAKAFSKSTGAIPPLCSWSEDNSPFGCNDFRSAKRDFIRAALTDSSGTGIEVLSNGAQVARSYVDRSGIQMNVLDYYGGTNWGGTFDVWEANYGTGHAIAKGDVLEGTVTIRLLPHSQ